MKLTRGEFCQFSLPSKINLLKENGQMLMKKKIDAMHEIRLFLIYDFYVEVFFDFHKERILKVEPIVNNNWLNFYI